MDCRDLDCLVAEHIFGYTVEEIRPSWYKLPVKLFKMNDEICYSWDANACNACIYRNGVDETLGFVPPLPNYSTEIDVAWEIVTMMKGDNRFKIELINLVDLDSEEAAQQICLAALKVKGYQI